MKKLLFYFILLIIPFVGRAAEIQLADPTIYYEQGVYYLTGTLANNGFRMYKSTDLVHWTLCGNASEGLALHKNDVFGEKWFWAPQIFKHDGTYYMAYTANELIAIAKSDSPMGPFKMTKKVELPHNTGQIDPYVFFDDDGKKYLYYVRFDGGNTLYVSELTDDLASLKPNTLKKCFGAELPWEKRMATVTEGPTMFKDGGYYYLIYSANGYESPDYAVGYAYSTSPTGPWTKSGRPFLSRHNIGINGTGHGDLFRDEKGQWYYVFHVHASNSKVQTRRTAIVPITVTDDVENKFIPQVDRMYILTDDAPAGAGMPEAKTFINAGGIKYSLSHGADRYMQVECRDVVDFGGYEGEIVIPETVMYDGTDYPVKRIGTGAFFNCGKLQKVTLPNGITQIGTGAFEASGIRNVTLPETVTQLGYQAFKDCAKLLDVVVEHKTPIAINDDAFDDNTYKKGKLWVPAGAADEYKSNDVWSKFVLMSGVVQGKTRYDFERDGIFYTVTSADDATVEVSAQTDTWATYRGPRLSVPAQVEHNGKRYDVTALGRACFYDCRMVEEVALPEGMTLLNSNAFYNCFELSAITLPSTVRTLNNYVFRNCSKLTRVTCLATTPPRANNSVFQSVFADATLYVPKGTKALYAAANAWKHFADIVEIENTGIENMRNTAMSTATLYNITGQKVAADYKGIVIAGGKKYLKK